MSLTGILPVVCFFFLFFFFLPTKATATATTRAGRPCHENAMPCVSRGFVWQAAAAGLIIVGERFAGLKRNPRSEIRL
jgi:hypothetical protein